MTRTSITILSSDRAHLHQIAGALKDDPDAQVSALEGSTSELRSLQKLGDVVIINGKAVEAGGLDVVELLGHAHPETAFIVVTENQSAEFLRGAMRAGVREVLPCPVPEDQLRSAIERLKKRIASTTAHGKVFAFIPAKGGSGSTFLATNLGYVLAGRADRKILLLDLNLQFGDAALFVTEQQPSMDVSELARQIHRLDASLLSASLLNVLPNYGLLPAPDDPAQSVDVKPQHVETLLAIARKHYDYTILDLGRSLDGVTLKALDMADVIFPVLQVGLPYIRDGKRLLGVLRSLGYTSSKIKLIVNRFQKGTDIGLADLEKALGIPVYKTIPNSYQTSTASANQGVPISKLDRNNAVSRGIAELANDIAPAPEAEDDGWLGRLLRRK
jgi:pilus assembly protein CpaE